MILNIFDNTIGLCEFEGSEFFEISKYKYQTNIEASEYIHGIVMKYITHGVRDFIFYGDLKNAVFVRDRRKSTKCDVKCRQMLISCCFFWMNDCINLTKSDRVLISLEGDVKYRVSSDTNVRIGNRGLDGAKLCKEFEHELKEGVREERRQALNQALAANGSLDLLLRLNEKLMAIQKKYPFVYFLVNTARPLRRGFISEILREIEAKRKKKNDLSALGMQIFRI
jgi:hypothetical protein